MSIKKDINKIIKKNTFATNLGIKGIKVQELKNDIIDLIIQVVKSLPSQKRLPFIYFKGTKPIDVKIVNDNIERINYTLNDIENMIEFWKKDVLEQLKVKKEI